MRVIDAVEQDLVYVHNEEHPLPDGWKVTTLEGLISEGGLFCDGDWVESKDQDPNGDVRLIQLADIGVAFYRDRSDRYLTSERASALSCTFLQRGDILVARMPDPLGRACLFPGDKLRAVTVVDVAVIRPNNPEVDSRWLMHRINSMAFRNAVASLQSGSTRLRISRRNLSRIAFPLPPLAQQLAVVDELEKQFSRLDEAVANLQRVKANLKRYKASVLKAAVEGRLVETEATLARREGRPYESAQALIAKTPTPPRPNRFNSRTGDVILGHGALAVGIPPTQVPEGWQWVNLVEIAKMETGHTPSRGHPEWWDGDVPWIGIADARDHHERSILKTIQYTNSEGLANSAARLLPAGTVCVSRTASVGYVVVMGKPMATSQDFVNWVPTIAVTSDWLRVVFTADRDALIRFGKGSVHKTIYFPEWLSASIALPPQAEQARIVAEVDRHLSIIHEVEAEVDANLKRAQALQQATLSKMFSGTHV